MTYFKALARVASLVAIGSLPLACAQPSNQSGMQGRSTQSADMQTMMNQCADMRRQMAQGTHPNTPEMAQMMRQCDEMDRSMGSMPAMGSPASTAAPPATRSR